MKDWNPDLYRQFEAERTRPAQELLNRIPLLSPLMSLTSAAARVTALNYCIRTGLRLR
ncbi:hypothetical protein ERHA54_38170 [Erwinia rhapontici]|nr:hypothetical protein ERHA54_38170 [Erwinia rhapontici]